jgi:GT2 family glycosyltransferase
MLLSVVLPTYNRRAILERCLSALGQQTLDAAQYEIVVVDDGSQDGTREWLRTRSDIRLIEQPRNAGPAAARNAGIKAARGDLVLFLGDDIVAPPRLLEQHVREHAQLADPHAAVLGYAPWGQQQEITPLMRYLFEGRSFQQFRYHAIRDPEHVPYGFFYTCNLSLHRSFLLDYGLFDEEFRHAYGEDTELAYRLSQHGLRLVFRRELVAEHYHPTSYRQARKRTRVAGQVTALMARKHPELADLSFLNYSTKSRIANWFKRRGTEFVIDPLLDFADRQRWDAPWLARAYDWSLRKHQLWGLQDAVQSP